MSAPDTNIERQQENHAPALLGIKGAMLFGGLMLLSAVTFAVGNGQAPTKETMTGDPVARAEAQANSSFDTYAPGTNVSN